MSKETSSHRRHGEGTVTEWSRSRGPGTKYQASIRITLPTGKRKRIVAYGRTPREALASRKEKVNAAMTANPAADGLTLKAYSATWLQYLRTQGRKEATIVDYAYLLRSEILPTLGDQALDSIRPPDIEHLQQQIISRITAAYADTPRGHKWTGRNTANKVRKLLLALYKYAIRQELVSMNPAQPVPNISNRPEKARLWTPTEIHKFLHAVRTGEYADPEAEASRSKHSPPKESWYSSLFYVALSTGLRLGEIVALQWSDVRDGKLHVERTYSQVGKTWQLGTPKTRESRRALPLGPNVMRELERHRMRLDEHIARLERVQGNRQWAPNNWVFPSQSGGLLHPPNVNRRLAEYAARAGVPRVSFHSLRKIFTTEFLRAGGSPKQAQYWLGHTTSKLVMEVYGGLQVELDLAEAVLNIDELTGINDD